MGFFKLTWILSAFLAVQLAFLAINCDHHEPDKEPDNLLKLNNDLLQNLIPKILATENSNSLLSVLMKNTFQPQHSNNFQPPFGSSPLLASPLAPLSNLATSLNALTTIASSLAALSTMLPSPSNPLGSMSSTWTTCADTDRTTDELIISRGFAYDDHLVETRDGYVLRMYRLYNPYASAIKGANNLHPVLLQHGLFGSSSAWLINSEGEGVAPWINKHKPNLDGGNNLAFLLANLGHDVWLGNNRGVRYSQNHTTLSPEDDEFWDFSIDDYAKEDAPAMLEYIRRVTGKDKISVIGHSFGATQFMGLLSIAPEYAEYIDLLIGLAPIGYLGNVKGPLGSLLDSPVAEEMVELYHGKFPPDINSFISFFIPYICGHPFTKVICTAGVDSIAGLNAKKLNQSRLSVYFNNIDYVSVKVIKHLFQAKKSDILRLFDYGEPKNMNVYGFSEPPEYPYESMTFDKIVFVTGSNDNIASKEDMQQLRQKLEGKILIDFAVKDLKWNHFDFIYGTDAYDQVNQFIVEALDKYTE